MSFDLLFQPLEGVDFVAYEPALGARLPAALVGTFGLLFGLWYAAVT